MGGEPRVRYRELDIVLPQLAERGLYVQLVTSAVRPIPPAWASIPRLQVCVSFRVGQAVSWFRGDRAPAGPAPAPA